MIVKEGSDNYVLYNEDGTLYEPPDSYSEYIKKLFPCL
jgi:hypothetical protein